VNDDLQSALASNFNDLAAWVKSAAGASGDFIAREAPLFVQEYVAWVFWRSAFAVLACLLIVAICVYLGRRLLPKNVAVSSPDYAAYLAAYTQRMALRVQLEKDFDAANLGDKQRYPHSYDSRVLGHIAAHLPAEPVAPAGTICHTPFLATCGAYALFAVPSLLILYPVYRNALDMIQVKVAPRVLLVEKAAELAGMKK